VIMFDIMCPPSFDHIATKWVPEIRYHCPNTPFILVGNKKDLILDPQLLQLMAQSHQQPVTCEKVKLTFVLNTTAHGSESKRVIGFGLGSVGEILKSRII